MTSVALPGRLASRFVCGSHRSELTGDTRPPLTWNALMALTNGAGGTGRVLRSAVYGVKGCADMWRRRDSIRGNHKLADTLLLALRTGCDSRDIAALKKCGGLGLAALHGTVPRARRAEYRDWHNCAVAAANVNDKLECGRRLRQAGIEVADQIPLTSEIQVGPGTAPHTVEVLHPALPAGTWWMLKDRHGLQGEAMWAARALAAPRPAAAGETGGGLARVRELARAGDSARIEELARCGRLVAEEMLWPEAWFAQAGDTALPTVRVVTSRLWERTEVVGLVLFRGGPGAVAANRRQGGTAHTIDENGTCGDGIDAAGENRGPCGYRFPEGGIARLHHLCTAAHNLFPCLGSVGWDVGLSSRGAFLLEGNANWGMNVPQLMPGRAMLGDFQRTRFRDGWSAPSA